MGRRPPQDRLLDYWIGLESLFARDRDQELSFRVSLGIAAYLGADGSERLDIFDRVRKSYAARSRIAHGAHDLPKNLDEIATETGAYLRLAILRLLQAPEPVPTHRIEHELLAR